MKARTVKEGLIAIKWILENKGWHQGTCFRDAKGHPINRSVKETNDNLHNIASCCLFGAHCLVEYDDHTLPNKVLNALQHSDTNYSMSLFNDEIGRTKDEVITLLDKVIRRYQ